MSETIGEIQDRLRPDHLLQQAKDGVKEAATGKVKNIMNSASETAYVAAQRARGAGDHLAWYAKEHPIRIAITARRDRVVDAARPQHADVLRRVRHVVGSGRIRTDGARAARQGRRDGVDARETVGEYASTAKQAVGEYASSARETVGEYASTARDTVNEYAASAASTAKVASRRVRSAAGTATTATNDWVQENPLAAGALAVAVGAAIGLACPATDYEDRAMGETRDQAVAKAKTVANNLKQNVGDKVAAYAENVVGESLKSARPPSRRWGSA